MPTKHFSYKEFGCKCGKDCGHQDGKGISPALLIILEIIRDYFGAPVQINSGIRCAAHNKAEGGSSNSRHLLKHADAADIVVVGVHADKVADCLEETPISNILGIGRYNGRTHVDVRGYKARWDCR